MKDSRPAKPERRWYEFSLRTLLVFVSEANTLSARRSVMNNSAFLSVVLVLAALTAGFGKGPDTTAPSPEPPAAPEATPASAKAITNSISMKMVLIPAGEFTMGSPDSDSDAPSHEPQHRVRITKPFYLGATEVTQGQYEKVMGKNPSNFKASGPDAPVEMVSWDDAQEFCRKLSELAEEKEEGRRYRLPTEAEWEYACRAGSAAKYCYGDDESRLDDYAWYSKNSDRKTH
jgi:formylglycine-generating enzyme required for sulfatase activity